MTLTGIPASRGIASGEVHASLLFRLLFFALLAAMLAPAAFSQYQTFPIYISVSSVAAGSHGATFAATVNDGSSTANFNVCFDTGYGKSNIPIAPYAYVNHGDSSSFNFDVPPSTIQAVPPSVFVNGSFTVSIYSIPPTYAACSGNPSGAPEGNTVTLNYPVLNSLSLPYLPEQNAALTGREPSSITLSGSNFIGDSGNSTKGSSVVKFLSSTALIGTVSFVSNDSLVSTIPATISAAASAVKVEVCNTATYSYCSNTLALKIVPLQSNPGTLSATPGPALTTKPVTLTASFGPVKHSTAGAPSGAVTFADSGNILGTANLVLDKTATFAPAPTQQLFTYALPIAPIVADFNRDGIPDTLLIDPGTGNAGATLHLLLGTVPLGSFRADQQFEIIPDGPSFVISSAAVGDFNGDGIPDIIVLAKEANHGGTSLYTLLGNGDGTFRDGFITSPTLYGSRIVAGDFNKDGKQDIVIAGALDAAGTVGLQVFLGDGNGTFKAGPATTGLRTAPSPYFGDFKVVAADFNTDGYPDVAVLNGYSSQGGLDKSIEVYQNDGSGFFTTHVRIQTDDTPSANFFVAALGPGMPLDIILTSTASQFPGIDVARNESTTSKIAFNNIFKNTLVPGLTQVVAGDFDGDGLLDLAVDDGKTIHVLSGDGSGAFTAAYTGLSIIPPGTTLIAASDQNGDKYADLLLYTTGERDGNSRYPISLHDYITAGTATATLPPATFAAGSHPLTASTNGTFTLLAGTASITLTINTPAESSVRLSASPTTPANYGTALVELTAVIPVPTATGTMSFYNGTTLLGTAPLVDQTNSTATFTTAVMPAGAYFFKAVYAGDVTHGPGTSAQLPYVIKPVAATLSWAPAPASITYGSGLSAAQLDATATGITGATVAGNFTYAPALGTILTVGTYPVLATFNPIDKNYTSSTVTRNITVVQATPTVAWAAPASIIVGTKLSSTQLDATATGIAGGALPGTFSYSPSTGTLLTAGTQTLKVTFTPTDLADYTTTTTSVSLQVVAVALTALSSTTATLGDPAKTITLTGTGFVPNAIVQVNGSAIPTTFVNATNLTATIPVADFLSAQILQISVAEASQGQTTASIAFLVSAPLASAVFFGPSSIAPGSQTNLAFQLTNPYPVDLTATFTLSFNPSTGLPNDPNVVFASGGSTYVVVIPANSTATPSISIQDSTVAGTMAVSLMLEAGGANVTPPSVQPLIIEAPLAVPGVNSAALTRNGNILTVALRGLSNPRDMSSAKFHFTPVPGGSIGTEDVTIDVVPIFTTWYADPASLQYGSTFTYTQTFNLSSDASVVSQVSVTLTNSVGVSQEADTQ